MTIDLRLTLRGNSVPGIAPEFLGGDEPLRALVRDLNQIDPGCDFAVDDSRKFAFVSGNQHPLTGAKGLGDHASTWNEDNGILVSPPSIHWNWTAAVSALRPQFRSRRNSDVRANERM